MRSRPRARACGFHRAPRARRRGGRAADAVARAEHLRLGQHERQHRDALLALRAEDAKVPSHRLRSVGRGGAARHRSRPRSMSASSLLSRSATVGSEPSYASAASPSPSPPATSANVGDKQLYRFAPREHELTPELRRLSPSTGQERRAWTGQRADAAKRGVALADGARVLVRRASLAQGRSRPTSAVEIGAASRRRALDDRQPVGCEHERRQLVTKALGRASRSLAVEPHRPRARRASGVRVRLERVRATFALERDRARPSASKRIICRRGEHEARSPVSPRGGPRAGSSSRRRSGRASSTTPGDERRARGRRTSGSRGA